MTDDAGREFIPATPPGAGDASAVPGWHMLRAVLDSVPGRVVALDTAFR